MLRCWCQMLIPILKLTPPSGVESIAIKPKKKTNNSNSNFSNVQQQEIQTIITGEIEMTNPRLLLNNLSLFLCSSRELPVLFYFQGVINALCLVTLFTK